MACKSIVKICLSLAIRHREVSGFGLMKINVFELNNSVRYIGDRAIAVETRNKLAGHRFHEGSESRDKKITVVGTGDGVMAGLFALLAKGITKNVCMIDIDEQKLMGEQMDLLYGAEIIGRPNIVASKDYAATAGSDLCVYAAGSEREHDESESDYLTRNVCLIRHAMPQLVKFSPNAVYLIASEPNEILAYQAWRASGLQKHKVIGTGTNLDSAKFQHFLAEKMGVSARGCGSRATGRCGKPVAIWSAVTVAGVCLRDLNPKTGLCNDPEDWREIYTNLMKSDDDVRALKGKYTWAAGLSIADICEAILINSSAVRPVSIYAKGEYSIKDEVFVALPCVLGCVGVTDIVRQPLSVPEAMQLKDCVRNIARRQESLRVIHSIH